MADVQGRLWKSAARYWRIPVEFANAQAAAEAAHVESNVTHDDRHWFRRWWFLLLVGSPTNIRAIATHCDLIMDDDEVPAPQPHDTRHAELKTRGAGQ